jgi:hypothetical protein
MGGAFLFGKKSHFSDTNEQKSSFKNWIYLDLDHDHLQNDLHETPNCNEPDWNVSGGI